MMHGKHAKRVRPTDERVILDSLATTRPPGGLACPPHRSGAPAMLSLEAS